MVKHQQAKQFGEQAAKGQTARSSLRMMTMTDLHEVTRSAIVAFFAGQDGPQLFGTSFKSNDPWTVRPWRIMSNMLVMTAFKLSNPLLFIILV